VSSKEDRVYDKVLTLLAAVSQVAKGNISDTDLLASDLGIARVEFPFLSKPLSRITLAEKGRRITRQECNTFTTVKSVQDLAKKKVT